MKCLFGTYLLLVAILGVNAENNNPYVTTWLTQSCYARWPSTDNPTRSIPAIVSSTTEVNVNNRNLVPSSKDKATTISARYRMVTKSSNTTETITQRQMTIEPIPQTSTEVNVNDRNLVPSSKDKATTISARNRMITKSNNTTETTTQRQMTIEPISQTSPEVHQTSTNPSSEHTPESRIVGGESISINEVPYQLSLMVRGKHICGASIIGYWWAITAAHCCKETKLNIISLRAGSSIRESGGNIHKVYQKFVHNQYNSSTTDYDIALLMVSTYFNINAGVDGIAAVKLPYPDQPVPVGAFGVISGYGTVQKGGPVSYDLKATTVPILSKQECQTAYTNTKITRSMTCAGYKDGGKDTCQGDSGGPLVVYNVLIGITSWGYGCASANYPGVYTKVSAFRMWIWNITSI